MPPKPTQEELSVRLNPEQFNVTQNKGTEPAFSGEYWDHWEAGAYVCRCCDARLFDSKDKFDAGCGWPSFDREIASKSVKENLDTSHFMVRTEVTCRECGAHLGHVFTDGPTETGMRYCINSASIRFSEKNE